MRHYIVGQSNDAGMFVFPDSSQYRTQRRPHKRDPEPHQNNIGSFLCNLSSNLYPIERIDRIDDRVNDEIIWRRFVRILGGAGKQERRVLQAKRVDLTIISLGQKLPG